MACSGNLLFSLVGSTYVATTPGGTLLVVSCAGSGGVAGWQLTSTFGMTSNVYAADPTSTCTPMALVFKGVLVDCGTINVTLSSDLTQCVSSSSVSASSVSASSQSLSAACPGADDCHAATLILAGQIITCTIPPDPAHPTWFKIAKIAGDYWMIANANGPCQVQLFFSPDGCDTFDGSSLFNLPGDSVPVCSGFASNMPTTTFAWIRVVSTAGGPPSTYSFRISAELYPGSCPGTFP